MTNSDFRIQVGLFSHPKFIKLKRKLGAEGALAYVQFLSHVATNKPDGILSNMDADDIAIAAGYEGDGEKFLAALIAVRFVDVDEQTKQHSIHDWAEHNPWAAGAADRSKKAQAAANARWGNNNGNKDSSGSNADKGDNPAPSNAPVASAQSEPQARALPQTQDSTTQPMLDECSEHDLALPLAPFSNAPIRLLSYPSPNQPIQTNPSVRPSPEPGTAQANSAIAPPGPTQPRAEPTTATDGRDGRTDGVMPKGNFSEAVKADGVSLDAQTAAQMRPEELLTAFKASAFWSKWHGHIFDILQRGAKRKGSEAVYLRPTILSILRGTEPLPGSIQSQSAERRDEREKAAQNRVLEAPKPTNAKRSVPPEWLPDVSEGEARELLNRAWDYLKAQGVTTVSDQQMVHQARKFWRDAHPAAPPADWEDKPNKPAVLLDAEGKPIAAMIAAKVTANTAGLPDYSALNNLPATGQESAP